MAVLGLTDGSAGFYCKTPEGRSIREGREGGGGREDDEDGEGGIFSATINMHSTLW